MPGLGEPCDFLAPLFVYGLLQPGELAYPLIADYVTEAVPGTVSGSLRVRDGLPLLDPRLSGQVQGHLLLPKPPNAADLWKAVANFEPGSQYRYAAVAVDIEGTPVRANVLVGRQVRRGTAPETTDRWSAARDPVFVEGLAEVLTMTMDVAPKGVEVQPDRPDLWRQFFRLQAAYLLLWAVVERYTALRYGPALDPHERVGRLDRDEAFQAAVVDVGAIEDEVFDSRDPDAKYRLRQDGSGAAKYFYGVRSNLSHRGKSAFHDGRLLFKALVELHDAIRLVLADQVPSLVDAWQPLNNDGGWLLRQLLPENAVVVRSRPG
ncbi:MAG: hypothetical protein QOG43_134 [Actinomycetota bacterium]|nr:hypothetical protein [Actinomycetota bacterium]